GLRILVVDPNIGVGAEAAHLAPREHAFGGFARFFSSLCPQSRLGAVAALAVTVAPALAIAPAVPSAEAAALAKAAAVPSAETASLTESAAISEAPSLAPIRERRAIPTTFAVPLVASSVARHHRLLLVLVGFFVRFDIVGVHGVREGCRTGRGTRLAVRLLPCSLLFGLPCSTFGCTLLAQTLLLGGSRLAAFDVRDLFVHHHGEEAKDRLLEAQRALELLHRGTAVEV